MKNIYSTKLITRSTGFIIPIGIIFIVLGLSSIILSAVDLGNSQTLIKYSTADKNSNIQSKYVRSSYSEQSIWPTLGKGIWCGLFFVALGIFSLIAQREKTLISIRILSFVGFISIFISLFLFLSSIIVFQRYIIEGRLNTNQKTLNEEREVVVNVLLFICGVLALISSLTLTVGTLIAGNYCQRQSDDVEDNENFYQNPPPPAYSSASYYS